MKRILVANRGEIAVRIIHACHDLGLEAVAVYADDDADALFVQLADEAIALHGVTPAETYLNIPALLKAAAIGHADAVHPGYGFLSENADFAQTVQDAGLTWIGPSPQTIRMLGDKVEARAVAAKVGAPMAPGTTQPVKDAQEAAAFARQHGLPIVIKAVHGGGGRGMKVVRDLADVEPAFESAVHEAEVAFGNGECFIERFLDHPRHVEVQVLGDTYGGVIAVGTRDCSLQRRNQKLIEEAPAPFLPGSITQRLEDAAVAICSEVGYVGAGTVEFLVVPDGTLSFMEVNTRIQVEHPVTEMTSGIDLVAWQLRIAAGASIAALKPAHDGHAMEFRLNAEDPSLGFAPFPGRITALRAPSGPGIRFDTGVQTGSIVSDHFDSMLAKLIVHATTREECLQRARRALAELRIDGVPTVVPFDRAVLADPDFTAEHGFRIYTRWIEEVLLKRLDPEQLKPDGMSARFDDADTGLHRTWIEWDGRRVEVGLPAGLVSSLGAAGVSGDGTSHDGGVGETATHDAGDILASITGTVARWLVDDGAEVGAGTPVVVLEAMKMEIQVTVPIGGVVHIAVQPGDSARSGSVLGHIES